MSQATANFFDRKKPWSRIKDRVVGSYLKPFCAKVSGRRQPIVLVDAFAGPGIFVHPISGEVELGSPFLMWEAAQLASVSCKCIFGNRHLHHHVQLTDELRARGIPQRLAQAVHLQSGDLLKELAHLITTQSLLIYMDPFGYKGCEFEHLKPFLERSSAYCTEIIVNLDVADLHRLAARYAVLSGQITPAILKNHEVLTAVLNGEWWKPILLDHHLTPDEMARQVEQGYVDQFEPYFKYRGSCPVPESAGGQVKYYINFFSNHPDALVIHNDAMVSAYNDFIAREHWSGPLFDNTLEVAWQDVMERDYRVLDAVIIEQVRMANMNGWKPARTDTWLRLLVRPDYFRRWTQSEYRERVKVLCAAGVLEFEDVRGTGRLNDDVRLYLKGVTMPSVGWQQIKGRDSA
jgi:three-Cys-motif partner protein